MKKLSHYFLDPLWNDNQILIAVLGICSALAVTIDVKVALTMAIAVSFVTGCSSFFVSVFRKKTPDSVRMMTQLAIISLFVIIVDQFLKAFFFDLSKILSVFVGLIITNCIVMGRAEAMAKNVPPHSSFFRWLCIWPWLWIYFNHCCFHSRSVWIWNLFWIPSDSNQLLCH